MSTEFEPFLRRHCVWLPIADAVIDRIEIFGKLFETRQVAHEIGLLQWRMFDSVSVEIDYAPWRAHMPTYGIHRSNLSDAFRHEDDTGDER